MVSTTPRIILVSGFYAVGSADSGFLVLKWNLDPRFQVLAGFRILGISPGFQNPGFQISIAKISLILKSRLSFMGPVVDFIGLCFKGRE